MPPADPRGREAGRVGRGRAGGAQGADGGGGGPGRCAGARRRATRPSAAPSAAAATLLAELGWDPSDPDALAERTGQPIGAVAAGLVELELAGLAERWVDGRYVRVGR
ncbi:MAG: hypothetical protein U1F17_14935 [Burkholderiaceae bacterium]